MKRISSLEELQKVSFYIYNDLARFCELHDLRVYLFGGTLIGAVRHKGFIPWDDDIDVAMSRTDYSRMLELTADGWISEKCRIVDPMKNREFKGYIPVVVYDNSKLISGQYRQPEELKIGISIFVYDGVPSSHLMQGIHFAHVYLLRAKHALCRADFKNVNTKPAKIFGPLLYHFYKPSNVYKYKEKIINYAQKNKYEESQYCACNCDYRAYREVCEKHSFETPIELEFEGKKCYAFKHYKDHLSHYYGNYMELPEEEEREPKHSVTCWIEDGFCFQ